MVDWASEVLSVSSEPIVGTMESTGRPMLQNRDGSISTERSITVTDPRLNDGRPTNIPSIWGGRQLDESQSVTQALSSGQPFQSFDSIEQAVAEAKKRSQQLGAELDNSPKGNIDFASEILSPAEKESTPAAAPIYDPERAAGISESFVAGFASDQPEAIRYLAQSMFPDEPLDQAVKRFGATEGGDVFYTADDGKQYKALPEGWSLRDVVARIAGGAGKAIPVTTGTATGIATAPAALAGPVGLAGSVLLTGGAAAGGEAARQKIGDFMMGEASTEDLDPWEVAKEGAIGGLGQGIGTGVGAALSRTPVADISRYNPLAARESVDRASQVGVDLNPAQATGLKSLEAQTKMAAKSPQTSGQMQEFAERQADQVLTAWDAFRENMSSLGDIELTGNLMRDTAKETLEAVAAQRKPFVDAAYNNFRAQDIPLSEDLTGFLTSPLGKRAWKVATRIADARGIDMPRRILGVTRDGDLVATNGKKGMRITPTAEQWDLIVRSVDDMSSQGKAVNAYGRPNSLGSGLKSRANEIRSIIDDATDGAYSEARKAAAGRFGDMDQAYGTVLKNISEMGDDKILKLARSTFDPNTRTPQAITAVRNYISKKNPAAWNSWVRLYIQDAGEAALRTSEKGEVLNPAGKLFKAFNTAGTRRNLKAAMDRVQWGEFRDLMKVMRDVSRVSIDGSDTQWNKQLVDESRKEAQPWIAKVIKHTLSPREWANVGTNISEWMTERNMQKNIQKIADIMTSRDPDSIKMLKRLSQMSPKNKRYIVGFGHLLSRASLAGADAALEPSD